MNEVEKLQAKFTLLAMRVRLLEESHQRPLREHADLVEAEKICLESGIEPSVLLDQVEPNLPRIAGRNQQHMLLAKTLRSRGWSASRIARVLHCAERTVERWTDSHRAAGA